MLTQTAAATDRWLRDILPASLFNLGPQGLMWWQWLAFPALAIFALAIGRPLGALTRRFLQRLFARTDTAWDDRLLARVGGGLSALWAIAIFRILLPWLGLDEQASAFVHSILAAIVVVTTFWALWRSVDVFTEILLERSWAAGNPSARSLIVVSANFIRGAVAIGGIVTTVAAFGYPVATMLAGLGIGGIALAFGAQKTIENLFGSVAIAADQPCRVGDTIKIEDFSGTVEHIGTRSTRIRTPDRTVITIPNGRLADSRIETFAPRDRIRLSMTMGLAPTTTETQLRTVLQEMERVLRTHPRIWPGSVVVRLAAFGASAFEVDVLCWFATDDYEVFRDCRPEVLLGFLRVVNDAGTAFAFPAPAVQLVTTATQAPPETLN